MTSPSPGLIKFSGGIVRVGGIAKLKSRLLKCADFARRSDGGYLRGNAAVKCMQSTHQITSSVMIMWSLIYCPELCLPVNLEDCPPFTDS